jgi:hypothetical protein
VTAVSQEICHEYQLVDVRWKLFVSKKFNSVLGLNKKIDKNFNLRKLTGKFNQILIFINFFKDSSQ